MTGFWSKWASVIILISGILCAAGFLGASVYLRSASAQTFGENGYVLLMEESEEEALAVSQLRFTVGEQWQVKAGDMAVFSTEDGKNVSVSKDSFVYYANGNISSLKNGTLVGLDRYVEGVTDTWSLSAGMELLYTGNRYVMSAAAGSELSFSDFIWKASEESYLLAGEDIEIVTASGTRIPSGTGRFEMHYGVNRTAVLFSDGENAWQFLTKGCQVEFSTGVILDCETGELLTPAVIKERKEAARKADWTLKTVLLDEVLIDETVSRGVSSAATPSTFRFHITDGEDGLEGEVGENGEDGIIGEDGIEGLRGDSGSSGEKGSAGGKGGDGAPGGMGAPGVDGSILQGTDVKVGNPVLHITDWNVSDHEVSFRIQYDELSYGTEASDVVLTPDCGRLSIYDLTTGEEVMIPPQKENESQQKNDLNITKDASDLFTFTNLQPGHEYVVIFTDTYTLNGETYENARLLERVFTTSGVGFSVSLKEATKNSLNFAVNVPESDKDFLKITQIVVEGDGIPGSPMTVTNDYDNITLTGLEANRSYPIKLTVTYETDKSGGTAYTEEFYYTWTTLKEAPVLGGVTMEAQKGLLEVQVRGVYDATADAAGASLIYGEIQDQNNTIQSVTYHLYNEAGQKVSDITRNDTKAAWFQVDGKLIEQGKTYYVTAEYAWSDGEKTMTEVVVKDTNTNVNKPVLPNEALQTAIKDHAWDSAATIEGEGISISFSGAGTGVYNTPAKLQEGTTYEAIRGSLLVNLNGTTVSVSGNHKLTVTFSDNRAYRRTLEYTNCEGKQGNIDGSFSLLLDVDGLLKNNAYLLTLEGYEYTKATDTYERKTLGSIVLRTSAEADITLGMDSAKSKGVGVRFWLGAERFDAAKYLPNEYDQNAGQYTDYEQYKQKVAASYRNLDQIVFELYSSQTNQLLGTCEVYAKDLQQKKASYPYDQSLLYRNFYGEAVNGNEQNYVGVGSAFAYRFHKPNDVNTLLTEAEMSEYQGFYIRADVAYDYTYERNLNREKYDYFDYEHYPNITMEQCVNVITINGGNGAYNADVSYQKRPIDPSSTSCLYPDGQPIHVYELANEDYADYNGRETVSDKYDTSLNNETTIGVRIEAKYKDINKITKTASFYGLTREVYTDQWPANESLTWMSNQGRLPFKFSFHMTTDRTPYNGVNGAEEMPNIYIFYYDAKDSTLEQSLIDAGYESLKKRQETFAGDKGYDYAKYDSGRKAYLVYSSSFMKRGATYMFAYDTVMDYVAVDGATQFSFPGDYFIYLGDQGYYYKEQTLRSRLAEINRQAPWVNTELIKQEYSADRTTVSETWKVYLNDPDGAVQPESFLNTGTKVNNFKTGFYHEKDYTELWDGSWTMGSDTAMKTGLSFKNNTLNQKILWEHDWDENDYKVLMQTENSTSITDPVGQTEQFHALITAMKAKNTDGSFGTEITVTNLDGAGCKYSYDLVYRLLDDDKIAGSSYYASNKLAVMRHEVLGYRNISEGTVKIEGEVESNQVRLTFTKGAELTDRIINVRIRADKVVKHSDGTETLTPIVVPGTKDYDIVNCQVEDGMMSFSLSELGTTSSGNATVQYGVGDTLQLTYEIYFVDGTTLIVGDDLSTLPATKELAEADTTIYVLKNMEGGSFAYYYTPVNTTKIVLTSGRSPREYWGMTSSASVYTGNDGTPYQDALIRNFHQTYPKNMQINNSVETTKDYIVKEELSKGRSENDPNYIKQGEPSTELHSLKTVETVSDILVTKAEPRLQGVSSNNSITNSTVTITVKNHNLTTYPENEIFHLYYMLYEIQEDESGEIVGETYLGSMIGENLRTYANENYGRIHLSDLKIGQKYRLYFYYKDCLGETEPPTDAALFGDLGVQEKVFYRVDKDETKEKAQDLKSRIEAKVNDETLLPLEGQNSDSGYYDFQILEGIIIGSRDSLESDFMRTGELITTDAEGNWVTNRRLTTTTVARSIENEFTKMIMVVERAGIGEYQYETILAPEIYYQIVDNAIENGTADAKHYSVKIPDADETTGKYPAENCLENYPGYQEPVLKKTSVASESYEAALSLQIYPGGLITPGYQYRVRSFLYQFDDAQDTDPMLISIKEYSTSRSDVSGTYIWNQVNYSATANPVTVQKIAYKEYIKLNLLSNDNNSYVDKKYYGRLYMQNGSQWSLVKSTLDSKVFTVGVTSKNVEVRGLDADGNEIALTPGTNYQVRFYALVDLEYNNQVNIMEGGRQLYGNDLTGLLYTFGYDDNNVPIATANLSTLYLKYLGSSTIGQSGTIDERIQFSKSGTMTTLQNIGTLGKDPITVWDGNKDPRTLTFHFTEAANLGELRKVGYTIYYIGADSTRATYYGEVVKATGEASLVDGKKATEGDVALSITNGDMDIRNQGTYQIQLVTYFDDSDVPTERLDQITVVVE